MARTRVLLIEDEESIHEPLAAALERESFAADGDDSLGNDDGPGKEEGDDSSGHDEDVSGHQNEDDRERLG